jgi:general secretion pathway protein H
MRRGRQSGFTLVELMLVALLMGLVASAVLFTVDSSGPQKQLKRQAQKMAALTELALDQATMTGRDYGLVIGLNEYRFVELFEQRWQPLDDPLLIEQQLNDAELLMTVDGFAWSPDQLDFSSSALFEEREVDLELDQKERKHIPQVLILSSGELTPFKIEFRLSNAAGAFLSEQQTQYRILLNADTLGMVSVTVLADE